MYPFTNCTNCGPRYSIIERLPYDRANTTMARFALCAACRAEYEDPLDRRFHAQPTACRVCGPTLELWNGSGQALGRGHEALTLAAARIRSGEILALKGLGGFHLMADASNEQAIARLRERKHRPHRPFAIMAPDLATANELCIVSELERRLLTSVEAPIVLLRRRRDLGDARVRVSAGTAPDNPYLGVMLPYTPLHHLLMGEVGAPIIATSANLSGDPMVTDEADVCARLHGIADCFLVHDRPIARAVDDSVVRVIAGRETVLRAARGYAPVALPMASPAPDVLATGGHLKSAIAIVRDRHIFLGPHIGDLQSERSRSALRHCTAAMGAFYDLRPAAVACDRHPDYFTTDYAKAQARRVITVPHHAAHVLACLADNAIEGPVLGVAWDGGGFGDDGTVWGGGGGVSFCTPMACRSAASLIFSHSACRGGGGGGGGGERAIREPRRSALGLLWEALGDAALDRSDLAVVASFSSAELRVLARMFAGGFNAPRTSSVGRLFDGVASLLDLRQRTSFEGQAAMAVEFAAEDAAARSRSSFKLEVTAAPGMPLVVDWRPLILRLLDGIGRGEATCALALAFHQALADAIVDVAHHVGEPKVVLTGGCFQNRLLTELAVCNLRKAGFTPYWHHRIPPNDGGLAIGQAAWAIRTLQEECR